MKSTLLIFLTVFITSLTDAAETKYLSMGAVKKSNLEKGKKIEVEIPIQIGAEYHIQANPASAPRLIPTTIEIEGAEGIEVGKPVYPKGNVYRQQGSVETISVYSGDIKIKIPLSVKPAGKPGEYVLKGKLRYQACNEKICFFPTSLPVEIPLQVR